jgi:hypothetical protein
MKVALNVGNHYQQQKLFLKLHCKTFSTGLSYIPLSARPTLFSQAVRHTKAMLYMKHVPPGETTRGKLFIFLFRERGTREVEELACHVHKYHVLQKVYIIE